MFRFTIRDGIWLSAVAVLAVGLLLALAELDRRTMRDRLEIGRLRMDLEAAESRLDDAEAMLAAVGRPVAPRDRD